MSVSAKKLATLFLNKIARSVVFGPKRYLGGPLISNVSSPPERSTLPSWSNTAASQRAWVPPVAVGENVAVAGSNKSPKAVPLLSVPPAKRTLPFFSKVAVCPMRAAIMFFVKVNTPVLGLKSSALAVPPPATSTLPLPSKVAVCPTRAVPMLPVRVKVPVAGSKSSAVARVPVAFVPPVTRTFPLASKVALCPTRALLILPMRVKVPVAGLKSSAVARVPVPFAPPAIRTLPLASLVAVCLRRANSMLPVAVKLPAAAHAIASDRTANSMDERKRSVLNFILLASSVCGLGAEGPGSAEPLQKGTVRSVPAERDYSTPRAAGVKANRRGIHSECRARRRFRGYMSRSLCDNNHRLSQLQSSRHVDSVGRDQLRIRHFGTQLDLLESGLFFRLGEKRQQVLASQPLG